MSELEADIDHTRNEANGRGETGLYCLYSPF